MGLPTPSVGAPLTATGGVLSGPTDTPVATSALSELDDALDRLGLVGEDGVSLSRERSTTDERAWGGEIAITLQTEYSERVSLTFLESSKAEVLKEVNGPENVDIDEDSGEIAVKHNSNMLPRRQYVFEMRDRAHRRRIILPNAQIVETGDVELTHSASIKYPVTMTAYPDGDGNCAYEYIAPLDAA